MNTHAFTAKRIALLALLAFAAPLAQADIYRWVEEDGNVTFSDKAPPDGSKVYELSKIPTPPRAPPTPQPALRPGEKADPLLAYVPSTSSAPRDAAPAPQAITVTPTDAVREARFTYRGLQGAAQDPCLRSPDPRCYERNKESYHPRYGYVAGGATGAPQVAIGATLGTSGGGAVGGGSGGSTR